MIFIFIFLDFFFFFFLVNVYWFCNKNTKAISVWNKSDEHFFSFTRMMFTDP